MEKKDSIYSEKEYVKILPGNQCDLYPIGSIHETEREIISGHSEALSSFRRKVVGRQGHYIPPFLTVIMNKKPPVKLCPGPCMMEYSLETPFVESGQTGDPKEMCMTCFEKKYIVNHRAVRGYEQAVRQMIKLEQL